MLVSGILGFQSLLLFFVLVAFGLIRRKWRNAAAKEEEIMKLLAMASEEAALAEVVVGASYDSSVMVSNPYQCVVCYCPTTRRCSQCKAVRYCSGKCQIIHWRQGHKDECHPPPISTMHSEEMTELGGEVDSCYDVKGSETVFASSSACGESSSDISSKEILYSEACDRLEKPLSDGFNPDLVGIMLNSKDMEVTPASEFAKLVNSADCVSRTNKLDKIESSHTNEKIKSSSQSHKARTVQHENLQPATTLSCKKLTKGQASAEKLTKNATKSRSTSSNDEEDNSCLFESKEDRSSSAANCSSSSTNGHFTPSSNGYHALPTKVPSLPQNARNGIKTSMQKVVQQFRGSKPSKNNLSGLGSEISVKNKMIFPYELFMKLYTHETMIICPFGLTNCGNRLSTLLFKLEKRNPAVGCYANAVLQCLAFTRPLTSYLLQGLHSKTCRKKDWCFICEFEYLIYKAREGKSPLSPIRILSKIHKIGSHLGHGREEDAHEFLRYAVDTMQSIFLNEASSAGPFAEESTLVGMTFGGYLRSKIKCMRCHGKSEQYERMMDLTVEIDGEIGTLEEALAQFTATETLDRENKYHCSRCKSYEKSKKKLTVLEAPNILTIVLKRFQSGNFEKLNKLVQFPEVLNMAPYMSGTSDRSPLYSLYAVVVHLDIMNAAYSGHYVCYVKNILGEWFKIDDSTVEPVGLERVLSEGAYMLLYARHSPRPPPMLGSNMASHGGKFKRRNLEAVPSNAPKSKSRSNSTIPSMDVGVREDPYDWRLNSVYRARCVDSSSESSSLFSCSDASSSSTVSKDSASSTDDFSDYIFGEAGRNWYRRYGHPSDTVPSSSYSKFNGDLSEENDVWGEGNPAILYSDSNKHRRNSTSQMDRSSGRESDFGHAFWANPFDVRNGVHLRRTNGERSAHTFYEV